MGWRGSSLTPRAPLLCPLQVAKLTIDLAFMMAALTEDELPERIIGAARQPPSPPPRPLAVKQQDAPAPAVAARRRHRSPVRSGRREELRAGLCRAGPREGRRLRGPFRIEPGCRAAATHHLPGPKGWQARRGWHQPAEQCARQLWGICSRPTGRGGGRGWRGAGAGRVATCRVRGRSGAAGRGCRLPRSSVEWPGRDRCAGHGSLRSAAAQSSEPPHCAQDEMSQLERSSGVREEESCSTASCAQLSPHPAIDCQRRCREGSHNQPRPWRRLASAWPSAHSSARSSAGTS